MALMTAAAAVIDDQPEQQHDEHVRDERRQAARALGAGMVPARERQVLQGMKNRHEDDAEERVEEAEPEPDHLRREDAQGRARQRQAAATAAARDDRDPDEAREQRDQQRAEGPGRQPHRREGVAHDLVGGVAGAGAGVHEAHERRDPRDVERQTEETLLARVEARLLAQGIQHREPEGLARVVVARPPDVGEEVERREAARKPNGERGRGHEHHGRDERDERVRAQDVRRGVGASVRRRVVRPEHEQRQQGDQLRCRARLADAQQPEVQPRHEQRRPGSEEQKVPRGAQHGRHARARGLDCDGSERRREATAERGREARRLRRNGGCTCITGQNVPIIVDAVQAE
jgi:hypothetical protein